MVPTHATKHGVRYRYYVSQPYLRGHAKPASGAIIRVPAPEIETAAVKALEEHHLSEGESTSDRTRLFADVARIEVRKSALALWRKAPGGKQPEADADQCAPVDRVPALLIPWTKPPSKRFKDILLPAAIERHRVRPIKFERRAALLKSIARGRAWLDEIISNSTTVEAIAAREKCSVRYVNMTISMAFIAPRLVKAAVAGRLPRGIGVAALRDMPAEWSLQFDRLGLAQN
jgi:hypothetical protein